MVSDFKSGRFDRRAAQERALFKESTLKSFTPILLGASLLFCPSCKEKVTGPETSLPVVFSGYSTKCLSHGIAKMSFVDSLVYIFSDSLVIDDPETTSCSNTYPFAPGYNLRLDTLTLIIADTTLASANCFCGYNVHFAFSNLPDDRYTVVRIRSWKEHDLTPPYSPYKYVTMFDTTYLGEVFRSR